MLASEDSTAAFCVTTSLRMNGRARSARCARPRLGHAGLGNPVFHQKDDPAISRDQIERLHDDLFEQEVDVDLKPDGPAQFVGQAQLLVVAAQGFWIGDLALGQKLGGARGLDLLVNQGIGKRSLPNADRCAAWEAWLDCSWKMSCRPPSTISSLRRVCVHRDAHS